ncbi:MAG: transcription-repair coupling factor [Chitinivibrionales bacterium]
MTIHPFKEIWDSKSFPGIDKYLENRPDCALFTGLAGSSDAFIVASLFESTDQPLLVLTANSKRADVLVNECAALLGDDAVSSFPSRDAIPYNMKSPFGPTVEARFQSLKKLMAREKQVYIAPISTLLQRVVQPRTFFNRTVNLRVGDEISQETLATWLQEIGFRRETTVQDLGTFAIRGGIFDVYPFISEMPLRIEFWGDYIESIRMFDVFTQKSKDSVEETSIVPMNEFVFSREDIETALERMRQYCTEKNISQDGVTRLEHSWKSLGDYEGIEWFLHWFDPPETTILDYLAQDALIVWDDLFGPQRRFEETIENYNRHLERIPSVFAPLVSMPDTLLADSNQVTENLLLFQQVFLDTENPPAQAQQIKISLAEQPSFAQSFEALSIDLKRLETTGYKTTILCPTLGQAERLLEAIGEEHAQNLTVAIGYIERGFLDKNKKTATYTEAQIFNRPYRRIRTKKSKSGTPISSFDSLSPGDFVVHVDHGIAQFVGIERISAGDMHQDCMVLHYQGKSKLYVPIHDFHKVQKYVGKDSTSPTLSKLGTATWEKLKQKTRESLQQMAQELVQLYAKREYLEGIKFGKDSLWQKEFEDAFIYDETPDQLATIKDVKKDMESGKPMDRLVCGDVGFGKTEVAMRAAFKAVNDGYQVAVLAPTTVLVAQHFSTFSERMADFPVRICMLSRFLSPREIRDNVKKINAGQIDIVIGTHRLLSQDVVFKNLGMLIIDEEQRFGVRHKEKLKQYRYKVDVLSMTATPIPRTLHMSLAGARDLSIINTPPRNRLPVDTSVMEYHNEVIKQAIEFELDRGGQAFVVHNRIKNLYLLQDQIEQLVPRARVIVAHGQMDEKELQRIMQAFIAGRYDVLLSTVIIENGIDIANVNTIIVNRADAMGLSQLYQLRGRVGRSSEQAYAYLLTPSFKQIDEVSLKRLRALEQYTDLGSGFQIAMRDLEIRGAGNILGTKQHGFIAAVGFELYCQLLKEEVEKIRGDETPEKQTETKIDIAMDAYIPAEFISDGTTRIATYQELSSAQSAEEIDSIESSLVDRFGPLPEPVTALLLVMRVKQLARQLGISRLSIDSSGTLVLGFEGKNEDMRLRMQKILKSGERQFEIAYEKQVTMKTALISSDRKQQAIETMTVLENVIQVPQPV